MRLIRNLGRRKLRTTLTIMGITIGIWALVVFGSMANKINALVSGGSDYYKDKVTVSAKGGMMGLGSPLSISLVDQVEALKGVDVVVPSAVVLFSDSTSAVNFGTPSMIVGSVAGADKGRETFVTHYASGRALTAQDEGQKVTVLGSDLARQKNAKVGGTIDLRGQTFTIVGILEPTLTAPDNEAMVPLKAAQVLFVQSLPAVVAARLDPSEVATGLTVYPKPGVAPQTIADEINSSISGVTTMTGADFDKVIGSATSVLNAILVGIGLISLVVGGLSVINTMAMSVAERTREIGIKRAIGGSRLRIVRELVTESALIGLVGGLIGLVLGAIVVFFANEAGRNSGTVLFELTLGTSITAIGFSTILGAIAGFLPALHAARLDPVTALRYE